MVSDEIVRLGLKEKARLDRKTEREAKLLNQARALVAFAIMYVNKKLVAADFYPWKMDGVWHAWCPSLGITMQKDGGYATWIARPVKDGLSLKRTWLSADNLPGDENDEFYVHAEIIKGKMDLSKVTLLNRNGAQIGKQINKAVREREWKIRDGLTLKFDHMDCRSLGSAVIKG